ncbi:hypothetical protein N7475_010432 [Penicillium sp. IBT 31633x]|nr:hypothetical protein N7475_010432 [Penicillium sp. IBT 31633x]
MFASFLLGSAVAYSLVMVIYRLHFHKLKRYPGPPLAAATGLYEIYFSAWGPGIFEHEIDEMHKKYGPIVRITPDEVHVQELFGAARELESGYYQPRRSTHDFQLKRPSIARIRSLLRMEVNQIINGLIQKHQVHRMVSPRFQPFTAVPSRNEETVQPIREIDIAAKEVQCSSQ